MGLVQTIAPGVEPVTLAEAKDHLRVSGTDDDNALNAFIAAARGRCESFTGRQLILATWQWEFESFGGDSTEFLVPKLPLVQIATVKYMNDATPSVLTTVTISDVDESVHPHLPGRFRPRDGVSWPTNVRANAYNNVQVVFDAGISSVLGVADELKQAMLLMIGHWHNNRENTVEGSLSRIPLAAEDLMTPFKTEWHG